MHGRQWDEHSADQGHQKPNVTVAKHHDKIWPVKI